MKKIFTIITLSILVLLTGCGDKTKNIDLDEEKILTVYTSHKPEVYEPIIKEFENRTGIWVRVVQGGTTKLMELLDEKTQNDIDVMFGGGVESYATHKELFAPYKASDQDKVDNYYYSKQNLWTSFSKLPIVIIYNNKLLSKEELPLGWKDLMDSKWKGQIAFADPQNSGSSCTALVTMSQILKLSNEEFTRDFLEVLNYEVSNTSQTAINDVVTGKKLLGITLEETAMKEINKGEDIGMIYPVEGTSAIPDGCALVKNAPHEENAKLFIDFVVSKDVQNYIVEKCCRRTIRNDIVQNNLEDLGKTLEINLETASKLQSELLASWVKDMEEKND